jgi:class 3 adenylate cyclase
MRDLPAGTVTFLFTDIEGSTKLLDEVGDARYEEALAEHRSKLREAFGHHGGRRWTPKATRFSTRSLMRERR